MRTGLLLIVLATAALSAYGCASATKPGDGATLDDGAGGDAGAGGDGGAGGDSGAGGDGGMGGDGQGGDDAGGAAGEGGTSSAGAGGAAGPGGSGPAAGMGGAGGAAGEAGAGGAGGAPVECMNVPLINEMMSCTSSGAAGGGTIDESNEFLELLNPGPDNCAISLVDYTVVRDGAEVWQGVASSSFKKGKRYVLAGMGYDNTDHPANNGFGISAALPKDGACVQLKKGDTVVDELCYGSAKGSKGSPAPAPAPNSSIARTPDGQDTGDNSKDFVETTKPTPGTTN